MARLPRTRLPVARLPAARLSGGWLGGRCFGGSGGGGRSGGRDGHGRTVKGVFRVEPATNELLNRLGKDFRQSRVGFLGRGALRKMTVGGGMHLDQAGVLRFRLCQHDSQPKQRTNSLSPTMTRRSTDRCYRHRFVTVPGQGVHPSDSQKLTRSGQQAPVSASLQGHRDRIALPGTAPIT